MTAADGRSGLKSLNLLDNTCSLFEHIYVIPHNLAGVDSLSYIAHHTFEEYTEDARELFEELDNFELIPEQYLANDLLLARDIENERRAVYIPYYDIKVLEFFHNFHENVSIITYADMAETLSHCIRRESTIYDIDGNLLDVQHYQLSGRPVGSTYVNKEKGRKKSLKQINVSVTQEEKKILKKMTGTTGSSVSSYIHKLIRMHLDEDYEKFLKDQQMERNNRKK